MKKLLLKISSILGIALIVSSCAPKQVHYEADKYCAGTLEIKERFTVCQLNDVHLSIDSNVERQFDYVKKVVNIRNDSSFKAANNDTETYDSPDLIVLNGDTFMNSNRQQVNRWFDLMDTLKVPYCFTYGNHDLQGSYPNNFIDDALIAHRYNKLPGQEPTHYAFYPNVKDDDVFGRSNYYVNITDSGNLAFQVYLFDSNTYNGFKYDVIHQDQIDWYKRCVRYSNGLSETDPIKSNMVKSLMFLHIPNYAFNEAIYSVTNEKTPYKSEFDLNYLDMREGIANIGEEDGVMAAIQEMKSTVSIGTAHDHINNTDIHYTGEDTSWPVRLIYGLKTGDGIYYDEDTIGATFYELADTPYTRTNEDGTKTYTEYFDLKMIHMSYEGEGKYLWQTKNAL